MAEILEHEGRKYTKSEEGHKGKKAYQVARILEQLQENPGVPFTFAELCESADVKYEQEFIALGIALEMCELVELYKLSGEKKPFYVWTSEAVVA